MKEGVDKLAGGYNGDEGAAAGAKKLAEGADKLKSGAGQLSDGVNAFVAEMLKMGNVQQLSDNDKIIVNQIVEQLNDNGITYQLQGNTAVKQLQGLSSF